MGQLVELNYDDYTSPGDVYNVWYPNNATFDPSGAPDGSQALRITVPFDADWGTNCEFRLSAHGMTTSDVLYQKVRFRLNPGWDMGTDENCRIWNAALADGPANSGGGGPPTGDDGFSERLYVTERGLRASGEYNLLNYTYHMDQGGSYGELTTIEVPGIVPGEWYTLESYVRLNTVSGGTANYDGVVWYKLDGNEVYRRENFRFRDTTDHKIEWGGPVMFYGGGYNAPTEVQTWYDGHTVSTAGVPNPPSASFSSSLTDLNVTFDAGASSDDGTIVSYDWETSDGQTASGETVSFTFPSGGTYTVTLTTTDDTGLVDTVSKEVTVSESDGGDGGGGGGDELVAAGSGAGMILGYVVARELMKGGNNETSE